MADSSLFANGRFGSGIPKPALVESNGNQMRQNPAAANGVAQKRKLPQPSSTALPESKVAKQSNVAGRTIGQIAGKASGIGRPASAAARHVTAKSIDTSQFGSKIGSGYRPPQRPQTSRGRPAGSESSKVDGADVTISSRTSFSSRNFCSDYTGPSHSVSLPTSVASHDVFLSGMANLSLCATSAEQPTARAHQRQKTAGAITIRKRPPRGVSSKVSALSLRSAQTVRSRGSDKDSGSFLTKESCSRVQTDFNVNDRLSTFESMLSNMMNGVMQGSREADAINKAMEVYKVRANELEILREKLESNNRNLHEDLNEARCQLRQSLSQRDDDRRGYMSEIDEARRRNRDETDEMDRKHKDKLDEMKREQKNQLEAARLEASRLQQEASVAAQNDAEKLEKGHQVELDDLRRELTWKLEEERRERIREVQAVQDEAQALQRDTESGLKQHAKDLDDKDEKLAQLSRQIEHERSIAEDISKQLKRSNEQNEKLESSERSLKAHVEFLQSDNHSQSQAFADLERQTQNALKETEEYKSQLRKEETIRRKLLNQIQDLKGNIRVFCRVRPPLAHESGSCAQITYPDHDDDAKAIEVRGPEGTSSLGKDMTKTHPFTFDRAFDPSSENAEIFTELSELVAAVCGGSFNTCIFSYGQTGSGKTYTMASEDGMIPRAVKQMFDTARDLLDKGWQYHVSGSFVEVYNENINDLLGRPEDFDKKKHEIRHDAQKMTTTITDVIETSLESAEHFESVLEEALRNRSIAATKANERSSRSHSVCILRIQGENHITGETCSSTLNLVDLAGSERLAHSQAAGAQLKETQNINKSLSCLKDVIAALGDAREHVPYRNSKLTYLLQNSLGGNSKTLMFVMISPLQEHLSETISSLNFATKVNNTRIVKKAKK